MGTKSWVQLYRSGGRLRRLTIGRYPALSLSDARSIARDAIRLVAEGKDPALLKARQRATAQERPDTIKHVAAEFIERHAKVKNRSWRETERIFARYVEPRWGKRDIKEITRRDVIELVDHVMDTSGPYMANRVLAAVRKLFNWTLDRDIVETSPAARVKAPAKELARERVLTDDEIKRVWTACDDQGWPFGPFCRLLMVTAQRRSEVASMRWEDIDLENSVWTIPRDVTKSDRTHEVPLSPLALEIISGLPKFGDLVFPSRVDQTKPVNGFGKAKRRMDELSGVTDWRFHDLRRTAGTNMARLGTPVSTISRVMNHKEGGVTAIYNRYSYLDEKRQALELWSKKLEELLKKNVGEMEREI